MSLFYKTVSLNHVYPTTLTADPTNIYTPTQLSWLESYCGHPYDCSQKVKWAVYEQGIIEPVNQHLLQLLNSDPPKMDSDTIIKVIPLMISVAPNLFAIEKKRLIHYLSTIHDQALIPLKLIGFNKSVNVSIGLPFLRVSPDHGTALDIAGKKKANPDSLVLSIKKAEDLIYRKYVS